MERKIEILAPAGSYECLEAALKSGADAIYVGGSKFGARAFATNFEVEELKKAIDFVHLHGKHLYLTVNTLLKNQELEELYHYLYPLYLHGLDAVIVQDLGVLHFVKKYFPDLAIHASTQMTVANELGATFLEREGVERVVTSRELSYDEVKDISNKTNLEIESFVHGALCYGYSGQCLYSSLIGGRSGNRGQCAQPCRLPYKVNHRTSHFMSLKDICSIEHIPEIIEAGVTSFKIEGRMKKPEYVALVTSMYRKYVDLYLKHGKKSFHVLQKDLDDLKDIFNRGNFHNGYWGQHNGKDMITFDKPSHQGLAVASVVEQKGKKAVVKAIKPLERGDILDIAGTNDNYTLGQRFEIGQRIELNLRKGTNLKSNTFLYRTRNQSLIDRIQKKLQFNKFQLPMDGCISLLNDSPVKLQLTHGSHSVCIDGPLLEIAKNAPTTKEMVQKQLNKTGNTSFYFDELTIKLGTQLFVPTQLLNDLRRTGIMKLERKIVESYRREDVVEFEHATDNSNSLNKKQEINVLVETKEQFDQVVCRDFVNNIYVSCNIFGDSTLYDEFIKLCQMAHRKQINTIFVMPHILRTQDVLKYKSDEFIRLLQHFDGVLIRNIDSFELLNQMFYKGNLYLDYHVYTYNNESIKFWNTKNIMQYTASLELNVRELKQLDRTNMELNIYGYAPMMISAQCLKKTTIACNKQQEIITFIDRKNTEFSVKTVCESCYNIIYNHCPTSLLDDVVAIEDLDLKAVRLSFSIETAKEVEEVLNKVENYYRNGLSTKLERETTKGHFNRGIN